MVDAYQSVWAVNSVTDLYNVLMGNKNQKGTVNGSEEFDPVKATDEERAVAYEKIIKGVMGVEFYNSLVK